MRQIKSMPLINKKEIAYILLMIIATIAALANTLTILYNNMNRYYIWTFAALFMLSLSAVLNQLLLHRNTKIISNVNEMPVK